MNNIRVIIGKSNNFEREIYRSVLFYDELEIKFFKEDKEIYITNILPNRISFEKNRKIVLEKIERIEERLNIKCCYIQTKKILLFEKILFILMLLIKNFINKFFIPTQWIVGYRKIGDVNWEYLQIPSDRMWADPFIVYENNKYYLFYEELFFNNNKGQICVGELDIKNKKLKNKHIILNKEYHLSYPYIFKLEGTWYMIPETSENKTVDLYKAKSFPDIWEKEKTLLSNIDAADSSLVYFENNWYLFTSEKMSGISHNDELSIYKSSDIIREGFEKLSSSPVISDIRSARMGGKFFYKNNNLYRVAQDCSKRYGYRVKIFQVQKIEKDNYSEKFIEKKNYPNNLRRVIAMHTYNFDKEIEVADFKIIKFDISSIKRTIKISLNKIKKYYLK